MARLDALDYVYVWRLYVHDRKICSISHFKAFYELLASCSIITLDAQKNAVYAICIFYTLQYSMIFRRFNNILRYYILFCCFCNRWFNIYMRILKRFMYIILLIIIYNRSSLCLRRFAAFGVGVHRLSARPQ